MIIGNTKFEAHWRLIWGSHKRQSMQRDPPRLWNPGQTSPEVQNRGINGPTKRTCILQNTLEIRSFQTFFFFANFRDYIFFHWVQWGIWLLDILHKNDVFVALTNLFQQNLAQCFGCHFPKDLFHIDACCEQRVDFARKIKVSNMQISFNHISV